MPLTEINKIIATQKSISTSKLKEMMHDLEKAYKGKDKTINDHKSSLRKINRRFQLEKEKADRRARAMEDYENLKYNYRNLKREYNILLDKIKQTT